MDAIMNRKQFMVLVLALLISACNKEAANSEQMAIPSPPLPIAQTTSLGRFPFPVGTTWVYSRVQYDPMIGDPTQIVTATNLITETVVRDEAISDAALEIASHPAPAPLGPAADRGIMIPLDPAGS